MGKVISRVVSDRESRAFRAYTTAIQVGDMLCIDTAHDYKVVPMAAATDDALFCGISQTEIKATEQDGDPVVVLIDGLIQIALVSAIYLFGAGVKWYDASTLTADGNANTIGWIFDDNYATRTSGLVRINVLMLSGCPTSAKLFDSASA